jgi:peroxiredoxin Q/BCP
MASPRDAEKRIPGFQTRSCAVFYNKTVADCRKSDLERREVMPALVKGAKAPDFELMTDKGTLFRLSDQKGSPVVLFFYPQDDTEGCTIENLEFSAEAPEFERLGVKLLGISPDSVDAHCAFRDKYALGVTLAADPERKAVEAFGLWGQKHTFGRDYIGLIRTSFLIDRDGNIAEIWPVTRIKNHAGKVLEAAKAMTAA